MENRPSWHFYQEQAQEPLVLKIMALQALEPEYAACAEAARPFDEKEREASVLRLESAANFYRELLAFFQIYHKQDLASPGRKSDWELAENLYGLRLREISRALGRMKAQASPQSEAGVKNSSRPDASRDASRRLVELRHRERQLQSRYYGLTSGLYPAMQQAGALSAGDGTCLGRVSRKRQWLEEAQAWAAKREELDGIFDNLLATRQELAVLLGYENYLQLLESKRPPSLPDSFGQLIAAPCRAGLQELHQKRKKRLKLERLRPYDMNTRDFCAFSGAEEWQERTGRLLQSIHPEFSTIFESLAKDGLIDPRAAPGKAPGAFCQPLPYSGRACLFLNLRGTRKDVMTGIHEVGHALHACLAFAGKQGGGRQIHAPSSEFFALTMELLALEHLEAFYPHEATADWAVSKHAESILNAFTSYLTIEEFEKSIYSRALPPVERRALFASIISQNLGLIDYSGYENALEDWMFRIPLLVSSPGYFRNYSVTLLGALYYYERVRKGLFTPDGLADLMQTQGGAPLEALFEKIGFSAGPETVKRLMALVARLGESGRHDDA